MRTDRFKLLIDHLENVVAKLPPEQFDINHWGTTLPSPISGPPLFGRRSECQTACCVMGHATNIPEFREAGLHLHWHHDSANMLYRPPGQDKANSGTFAVSEFMDIPMQHAEYLFHPDGYAERGSVKLETVIARLKQYVAEGGFVSPQARETLITNQGR